MKEENQRDCAVHINLNQIAEARKKKKNSVVKKKIKEIVQVYMRKEIIGTITLHGF